MHRAASGAPKTLDWLWRAFVVVLGALFFAWRAASNERGLIINGFIELGPAGARDAVDLAALGHLVLDQALGLEPGLGAEDEVAVDDDKTVASGTSARRHGKMAGMYCPSLQCAEDMASCPGAGQRP